MATIEVNSFGRYRVQYFKKFDFGTGRRKLGRVTAVLLMISEKRGLVESCTVTPLEEITGFKLDTQHRKYLVQGELGRGKNISACSNVEHLED